MGTLTQNRLKELLEYNPETGYFTRLVTLNSTSRKGDIAGCYKNPQPYINIVIDGESYGVHQLAFLYMEGYIPEYIDHEDTITYNNKWNNLRAATSSQNRYNSKIMCHNTVGIKGISYTDGRNPYYRAGVKANGRRYRKVFSVGIHGSKDKALQLAIEWVQKTRVHLHGEFANHG